MDIYTKPGSKVKYANFKNGLPKDRELCKRRLIPNEIYTVEKIFVGESRTGVVLKGIPGMFNSVMFNNTP